MSHQATRPAPDLPVGLDRVRPALAPAPGHTAPPPATAPQWVDATAWGPEDRAELRRLLTDRYDAYARVVTRTLASPVHLTVRRG